VNRILASGRSRISALRVLVLAAAAAAVLLGVAGTAGAGSPLFTDTGTLSVAPGGGVAVAYSTTTQSAYVKYTMTWQRDRADTSRLTHPIVSAPVTCDSTPNCSDTNLVGGTITKVTGCTGTLTLRNSSHGFKCEFPNLDTGDGITLTVIVKIDTFSTTAPGSITNRAALTVKEGGNDNQPQASVTDTFPTLPITTPLSNDTTSELNTYTNPDATDAQIFSTDLNLGSGNPQSTQARIKKLAGVTLDIVESDFATCPGTVDGLTCFGQLSNISVGSTFPCTATNLADANCMQFTVVVLGSSLKFSVNTKKVTIYHNGVGVPLCSSGNTDATGDCIVSIVQDPKTKNITWIARGPSNGGWGGAG